MALRLKLEDRQRLVQDGLSPNEMEVPGDLTDINKQFDIRKGDAANVVFPDLLTGNISFSKVRFRRRSMTGASSSG